MYRSSEYPNIRRRQPPRSSTANDHRGNSDNNQSGTSRGRRSKPRLDKRRQIIVLLASVAGLATWYLTPLSDWLTTLLLYQIPVEADILLGRSALHEFPYKTIYHPHWSPLVSQIGQELIATLESSPTEILKQSRGDSSNLLEDISAGFDERSQQYHSSSELKNFKWEFAVVQAPLVNAFALPGGIIRVTDQLLETLSPTRGELASLLGHEIGHCLFRHSQKRILQEKLLQFVVSAIVYEDHDEDEETFGEALGELLLNSAKWFGQQKFSRRDEYQADATGWALLQESQAYNPQSVQSLLTKLWTLQGKTPTTLDWMSTHPATETRIDILHEKWKQLSRREQRRLEYRPI